MVVCSCLALSLAWPSQNANATPTAKLGAAYQAFDDGDFTKALRLAKTISPAALKNKDYLQYLIAQSQYFEGHHDKALKSFRTLSAAGSRFSNLARWRSADCLWSLGRRPEAASAYQTLLQKSVPDGELAIARFRIARAEEDTPGAKAKSSAILAYKQFLRKHPGHRLSQEADNRLVALGDGGLDALTDKECIARGIDLIKSKKWEIALQELAALDTSKMSPQTRLDHQFWLSMSLFKRRRHYDRAGKTFLEIYKKMGVRAPEALFHGARAMSRADYDKVAIHWYQVLVREYPHSKWAAEAQFLSGWLEFNMGNYTEGLPYFKTMAKRFGKSRFASEVPWYLGMSYFLLEKYDKAIPYFEVVARKGDKEIGAKGSYWKARSLLVLGKPAQANPLFRMLVGKHPFSWYAQLSRSQLKAQDIQIGPFGDRIPAKTTPEIATTLSPALQRDPLILKADELIAAKLHTFAGKELRRGEKRFFKRHANQKALAMAILLDRYKKAGNFNRPWMLAVVHGGKRALNEPPVGKNKLWWQHAYPLAYQELVEKYRALSGFPDYYLYTIMRKESGFDPHTHSYADAQGLLQMIPPTTERVVPHLGLKYTEDLLFDPERNIQAGAWYIGRLLHKFRDQVPVGAGSYNGGPRAMMRWLKKNGSYPIDVWVELVSYRQSRKYMKRTTETYARYKYLYDQIVYDQPLTLNPDYVVNDIDY